MQLLKHEEDLKNKLDYEYYINKIGRQDLT